MRGALRLAVALWGGALLLGATSALAQQASQDAAPPPPSNAPADSVGPRELQNFSLQGTVTREADRPPTQKIEPATKPAVAERSVASRAAPPPAEARKEPKAAPKALSPAPAVQTATADPAPQIAQAAPPPPTSSNPPSALVPSTPPQAAAPSFPAAPEPAPASNLHGFPLLPWLLAALVIGLAGAFLFWRSRSRTALAGGPELDLFAGPQPEPAPAAAPAPRPAPAPPKAAEPAPPPPRVAPAPPPPAAAPAGLVSSTLRPWIDIAIEPLRCTLTDHDVTIEFVLELLNSGGAPARSVSIEGIILNAGPLQDQDLATFFANPPVPGNRIEIINPIHRVEFPTQVVMPREAMQPVEIGGRQVFVPLLAFNAIYRVGPGEGRSSVSFLVGRSGNGEKLAPFRLDLGPRIFRDLGARPLPTGIRR